MVKKELQNPYSLCLLINKTYKIIASSSVFILFISWLHRPWPWETCRPAEVPTTCYAFRTRSWKYHFKVHANTTFSGLWNINLVASNQIWKVKRIKKYHSVLTTHNKSIFSFAKHFFKVCVYERLCRGMLQRVTVFLTVHLSQNSLKSTLPNYIKLSTPE